MLETARGAAKEFDERGVAHLTAGLTVNWVSVQDPIIYLARATVFQKRIRMQGFGLDVSKYGGRIGSDGRLVLSYDGREGGSFEPFDVPATTSNPAHSESMWDL